jgi:hypothetical protein
MNKYLLLLPFAIYVSCNYGFAEENIIYKYIIIFAMVVITYHILDNVENIPKSILHNDIFIKILFATSIFVAFNILITECQLLYYFLNIMINKFDMQYFNDITKYTISTQILPATYILSIGLFN